MSGAVWTLPAGIPHEGKHFSGRRTLTWHPRALSPAAYTRLARHKGEAREPHNFWAGISLPKHLSLKWSGCRRGVLWQ